MVTLPSRHWSASVTSRRTAPTSSGKSSKAHCWLRMQVPPVVLLVKPIQVARAAVSGTQRSYPTYWATPTGWDCASTTRPGPTTRQPPPSRGSSLPSSTILRGSKIVWVGRPVSASFSTTPTRTSAVVQSWIARRGVGGRFSAPISAFPGDCSTSSEGRVQHHALLREVRPVRKSALHVDVNRSAHRTSVAAPTRAAAVRSASRSIRSTEVS